MSRWLLPFRHRDFEPPPAPSPVTLSWLGSHQGSTVESVTSDSGALPLGGCGSFVKPETLDLLRCPACGGDLLVAHRRALSPDNRLRDGLLACSACPELYPVLAWVPRLVADTVMTESERQAVTRMKANLDHPPRLVSEERLTGEQFRAAAESRLRSTRMGQNLPPKLHSRAESNLEYLLTRTEEKAKFVRTAAAYLSKTPRTILEVGGGQGGALTAFRKEFLPETAILLDLDPEWVELAQLRDPETELIRGDATRIPLREGRIDFLFSSAMLEHIRDWPHALREMVRISPQGLVCYNPNAGFPYDAGHLDAPLVTWLPKGPAARVAFLSHRLRRTGRTLESIRSELEVTHYILRSQVERELRLLGAEVTNAFGEFLKQTVGDPYHLRGGRVLTLLKNRPWLRHVIVQALIRTGTEPNAYLFYRRIPSGN
jgi:uncharacterized protein YbaR (Trm112 family)